MDLGRGENIKSPLEKHRRSHSRYDEENLLDNTWYGTRPKDTPQGRGAERAHNNQGVRYEKKIGAQDDDMKRYLQ